MSTADPAATILLVEDDAPTRTFLADNLTADGYELLVADCARDWATEPDELFGGRLQCRHAWNSVAPWALLPLPPKKERRRRRSRSRADAWSSRRPAAWERSSRITRRRSRVDVERRVSAS